MLDAVRYANSKAVQDLKPFMVMAFLVYVVSLWLEPPPIESYSRFVWPRKVHAGDTIHIIATVYRNKSGCNSRVVRTWVDDLGVMIEPPTVFNVPAPDDNPEVYKSNPTIPLTAKPGKLYMKTTTEFFCNWLQRVVGGSHFPIPDKRFEVLK